MFDAIKNESNYAGDPLGMTVADATTEGMYYRVWFHQDGVDSTCHPVGGDPHDHRTYSYVNADGVRKLISNSPQFRPTRFRSR